MRVDGASADAVTELATDAERTGTCRVIDERDDGCRLAVVVEASPLAVLAPTGATVRRIVADSGASTLVAEVPRDAAVREVVDVLDIADSTLNQHLRAALDELLSEFFGGADREGHVGREP